MAEDEEILDEESEDEELNWPAIAIALVVMLGLIGAGVWYFFLREVPEEEQKEQQIEYVAPEGLVQESIYLDMPEMLISPADSKGRYYLIVKFDIAMNDEGAVRGELIDKPWKWAQAQNIVIDVYSEFTREQLRTPKVKEQTRSRILEEFNHMLGWEADPEKDALGIPNPTPIKALYYSMYVLQ